MKIKNVARIDSEENNLGMKCYLIRIRVGKRSVQRNETKSKSSTSQRANRSRGSERRCENSRLERGLMVADQTHLANEPDTKKSYHLPHKIGCAAESEL